MTLRLFQTETERGQLEMTQMEFTKPRNKKLMTMMMMLSFVKLRRTAKLPHRPRKRHRPPPKTVSSVLNSYIPNY